MTIHPHKHIGLLLLLLSVYALIFIGHNQSKDEDWLLASASTFVRHGSLNIESMASSEWGSTAFESDMLYMFGSDNALYTKKGLLSSVALMPWVVVADLIPRLSTESTAMLMNMWVIALTALLIADVGATIGYAQRVSIGAALLFGLGSLAIPYTQTIFGEPLVALLLIAALRLTLAYHQQRGYMLAGWVGLSVGLTVLVNPIYGLFVPIVGLWMLGLNPRRWHWGHGVVFSLPTIAAVLIFFAYNSLRFGSALTSGYDFNSHEGFIHPIYYGAFGLLFSSYRGLFWYSPLTWLSLTGGRGLQRQHRGLAWTALALIVVNILALAGWWSWHGGLVWGPRFMVPVLPVLALFWLPALQAATEYRMSRYGVIALTVVAFAVQFLAVFYKYVHWPKFLNGQYPDDISNIASGLADIVMFDPRTSAIWGHALYLIERNGEVAPAIWSASVTVAVLHMLVVVVLAVLAWLVWHQKLAVRLGLPIASVVLLIVPALYPVPTQQRAQTVAAQIVPNGVVYAMTSEKWLERVGGNVMISAHAPTPSSHPYARTRWERALGLSPEKPFWLLTWFPEASAENWQEQELWAHQAYVSETWLDGNRLLRFDRRSVDVAPIDPASLGNLTLIESGTARHSDGVSVALTWQPSTTLDINYTLFVHFLDSNGNIVHQIDRAPFGGYNPTSQWSPDEAVTVRFFAPTVDAVTVRTGWMNPDTGALLSGETADFLLIPVTP